MSRLTYWLLAIAVVLVYVGLWTCEESFSFKMTMTGMSLAAIALFADAARFRPPK